MKHAVASVILLAGFAVLALLIVGDNSKMSEWDNSTFTKINNPDGKIISKIMVDLSKYGREFVWIVVVAILFIVGKKDGRRAAVLLTIAFLILMPLGSIMKSEIDRPRPIVSDDRLLIKHDADPSFPSGHATIVSAGAAILLLKFNRGKQIVFSIFLATEAIFVSYSRIYVGNHYPLDVIGGILLGTGVACAVIASGRYMEPIFSRLDSIKK